MWAKNESEMKKSFENAFQINYNDLNGDFSEEIDKLIKLRNSINFNNADILRQSKMYVNLEFFLLCKNI